MRQSITLIIQIIIVLISLISGYRIQDQLDEQHSFFKKSHQMNNLRDDQAFLKLEQIQNHPLGQKILQTIALQLNGNNNLSVISKLLNDLKNDLHQKQIEADNEKSQIILQCKSDLDDYDQRIQIAQNDIKDGEFKSKRISESIKTFQNELNLKKSQIQNLQDIEKSIRQREQQDSINYESRAAQLQEMAETLDLFLPKLHKISNILKEDSENKFIQEESINDALVQLSRIGQINEFLSLKIYRDQNPITSLVTISSALDPVVIQILIEKFQEIRKSILESLQNENQNLARNSQDAEIILNQIQNAINNLEREAQSDEETLEETITNRDNQEKRARDAHAELTSAINGNEQRQQQCEDYQIEYENNEKENQIQMQITQDIQNIIATKLEVVTQFISLKNQNY